MYCREYFAYARHPGVVPFPLGLCTGIFLLLKVLAEHCANHLSCVFGQLK